MMAYCAPSALAARNAMIVLPQPTPMLNKPPSASANAANACDWMGRRSQVPHYGLIKYAEGPKRVAALVLMDVHQEKLALPSQLICQPGMPCTSAVVEALMPFYGNVVRAIGSL